MGRSLFENEFVLLRAPEPEDLEVMYQVENDTTLWEVGSVTTPYSRYDLKQYIVNSRNDLFADRQLRLMIVLKKENRVIGILDISDFDPLHNRAAVGIVILQEYRKFGFAGQSIELLKHYCCDYLHIRQLYAYIPVDNEPSINLFESQGFQRIGVLKDWIRSLEKYKDVVLVQYITVPY